MPPFWHHQTTMGLQLHPVKRTPKSGWGIWIGLLQLQPQKIDLHFGGTNAGQPPQRGFGHIFKAFQPVFKPF